MDDPLDLSDITLLSLPDTLDGDDTATLEAGPLRHTPDRTYPL